MPGRRGFSLIIVLLISLVGLAVVGAVMNIVTVNSGAGMTASRINRNYNLLVDEVEKERAWIIASLDNAQIPKRANPGSITTADDLLVEGGRRQRTLTPKEMGLYGVGGTTGTVTVEVFDMQYKPEDLPDAVKSNPAEVRRLPPAFQPGPSGAKDGKPADAGDADPVTAGGEAYLLIRASLETDGAPSRASTVELALKGSKAKP
jgi:hypothetical protein